MRLGLVGYFLDFFFIPFVMIGLCALSKPAYGFASVAEAGLMFCLGIVMWTFLEYSIHRWLFHRVDFFQRPHEFHHAQPEALFGSPPIVGPLLILLVFYAPAQVLGMESAPSLTCGILSGYLAYVVVHFDAHSRIACLDRHLDAARRRHMIHHFVRGDANYGILTSAWDVVFRTSASAHARWESRLT